MSDDPREEQAQAQALSMLDEQAEERIRRVWHDERWFFSVIDVVGLLTESKTPRRYWSDLKRQLSDTEGFSQLYEAIVQLKLQAADGKHYLTDAADATTLLRIVQSVPSPKAEPVKQWLARTGAERLEEMEDPVLAAERTMSTDSWIRFLRLSTPDNDTRAAFSVVQSGGASRGAETCSLAGSTLGALVVASSATSRTASA